LRAYREVRLLSAARAAYLAGLIDGEGTITLSRKHAGEMRQLVVSISNTELNIRQFALVCTGAGKLTTNARPKRTTLPAIRTRCGIGRRWPCSRRSRCTCSRIREIAHGSCSGSTSDSRLATANIRRRCSRSEASSNARCLVCGPRRRKSPFSRQAEGAHWWRRRDSRFRLFRDGLDYAFIPQSLARLQERGVLSGSASPDPSAGSRRLTSAGL
jgi:hypothetical protein